MLCRFFNLIVKMVSLLHVVLWQMLETTEDCMHTFLPASQQIRGLFAFR